MPDDKVTPEDLSQRLGLPASAVQQFKSGEVVTKELEASNDKDLSLVVVTVVGTDVDTLWNFIVAERVQEIQDAVLSTGNIDPATMSLEDMDLTEDMVKSLLKAPFLSKEEAKRVKDGSKKGQGVAAYKQVLGERAKAYWEKGVKGIVPYDGKGRDPAKDLGDATDVALKLIEDPEIRAEINLSSPSQSSNPSYHRLAWAIMQGNDQKSPVLNHYIRIKDEYGIVSINNRFYSGADYDASQIIAGVVPTLDGKSAIFYTNHTYSPAVAGFGGSAKRSIGRKMMKGKLIDTMKNAQAKFGK